MKKIYFSSLKENERNASEICEELKNSLRQRSQQHRGRSLNLLKTLEEGWSKANNQLQKRRLLLDSSVDFHESAKKVRACYLQEYDSVNVVKDYLVTDRQIIIVSKTVLVWLINSSRLNFPNTKSCYF